MICKNNTTIFTEGDVTHVVLHSTKVVSFNKYRITLNTGHRKTVTTKSRMNQAAETFNLGYRVFQKNFVWYVRVPSGKTIQFTESTMSFPRLSALIEA